MALVRYSPTEQRLRALLRSEPRTTKEISRALYKGREVPFNDCKSVVGGLGSLARKMDINREPYRVARTRRAGPHPISFWLEKR